MSDGATSMGDNEGLDPDIERFLSPRLGRYSYVEDDVTVRLSNTYNRKPLPTEQENDLNKIWADRKSKNPNLWDGSKFRIHSVDIMEDGSAILNLGITGYKDFVCTNLSSNTDELKRCGLKEHGDAHAYLAHPLGVGAIVETTDGDFILLRRSAFCGEAVGKLDVPGGHPEPEELVGKIPSASINPQTMSPQAVVHEIFDSIHREICDEVNLPKTEVTFPVLLGIVRNTTSAGRPTAEFYSRCSYTSAEVKQLYEQGTQADAEETTAITFIPMSAITDLHSNPDRVATWSQMTASSKGCVTLYRQTTLADRLATNTK